MWWPAALLTSLTVHAQEPPNVILISLDTVRADHLSAYGYERDTSPFLEALAAEGVLFERAYAPTSTTGPTHATVFTGRYPITHGVVKNGHFFDDTYPALAERFAKAGYRTGAVISSFVLERRFGYARGFDDYRDKIPRDQSAVKDAHWEGIQLDMGFDRRADGTTDEALDWLANAEPDRPYFLFLHYFEPHNPYVPPGDYRWKYFDSKATPLENEIGQYDGSIAYTDAELARCVQALRSASSRPTLIVIFGDHGEGLMDHGDMFHGKDVHEESVRVPLIVVWPGMIEPGRRIAEPVGVIDLFPFLATVLNDRELAATSPGANWYDALIGNAPLPADRNIYLMRRHHNEANEPPQPRGRHFAVVHQNWKYIHGPQENYTALFNLADDPKERENVLPNYPAEAQELADLVEAWRKTHTRATTSDTQLTPEEQEALRALGYVE